MLKTPKTRTASLVTPFVTMFVVVLVLGILAGTGPAQARETGAREVGEPGVAARAWALIDLRSGEYLAGEDASEELSIASTTKIMAALVVLDGANLDEEVTVSEDAAAYATPAYSNVGLLPGDTLSVRELLMAALISSGDDAAYALAEQAGGGGAAGVNSFVAQMNEEARALGLKNTHFENPVGFDERGHYSSAQDLATMARVAMQNPEFREMVSTQYASIYTPSREIPLANTNVLLSTYGPATGIKTGTTPAAGESLVSSAARGDESYVCVILDSQEERFAASVRALRYGFAAYDRTDLVLEGKRYATIGVPYRRGESIDLVAKGSVAGLVDASPDVERDVDLAADLPDSAGAGTRLGRVVVKVDGNKVGETPLVAKWGYEKASLGQRVWYTVGGIFE
ncbi:MAG: D-alanyl-D-alanine carboxypeptidase [Rubrobacter sp.]|nr:D-alanyl-D-alanine carboxypeptidase [Rubrobacter sp.]